MTTAMKDTALRGQTVAYNGVQFGGSEARLIGNFGGDNRLYMMPPDYYLDGQYQYDEARRSIQTIRYVLVVQTVIFDTSEAILSAKIDKMSQLLAAPGKALTLGGLGLGFRTSNPDVIWGPLPLRLRHAPLAGQCAHEIIWSVEFSIKPCTDGKPNPLAFLAFNFSLLTQHDGEGLATRTMSGYAQMPEVARNSGITLSDQQRLNIKNVYPDYVREQISAFVPEGFERVDSSFRVNYAKNRLDFSYVDRELQAEPLPANITKGEGDFGFETQGKGVFAQAAATLSMTLTVAPGIHPSYALIPFWQTAFARQQYLTNKIAAGKRVQHQRGGVVLPTRVAIHRKMYLRSMSMSISWLMTGCIQELFFDKGMWEPMINGQTQQGAYTLWRNSVQRLWSPYGWENRVKNNAADDLVLDICSQVTQNQIGTLVANKRTGYGGYPIPPFQFSCKDIPQEQSWIAYDVRMQVLRIDHQTTHRKATTAWGATGVNTTSPIVGQLPNKPYTESSAQQHTTEYNGVPTTLIQLQFMGLRVQYKPGMPVLNSVGGKKAVFQKRKGLINQLVGDAGGCPIYVTRAADIYMVDAYIDASRPAGTSTLCGQLDNLIGNISDAQQ